MLHQHKANFIKLAFEKDLKKSGKSGGTLSCEDFMQWQGVAYCFINGELELFYSK